MCVAVAAVAAATAATAHTRSVSYSSWKLDEHGARVKVRIPRLELTRIALDAPPEDAVLTARAGEYLASRLAAYAGVEATAPCAIASTPEARSADEGWAAFSWRVDCAGGAPREIETAILLDVAPSHLHFARVARTDGKVSERVLTEAEPSWRLPSGESTAAASAADQGGDESLGASLARYVGLGVEHILSGWDHLAFVLALLLLAPRLGEVARIVTGFTVAHSVTLALAVLGFVHPDAAAVEAIIGFSVAIVAAEYGWMSAGRGRGVPAGAVAALVTAALASALAGAAVGPAPLLGLALFTACYFALVARTGQPARVRALLAFAFGLVHGFGFAGVLGQMQLPTERLAPALFGFNVGVELGQLAVVALAFPLVRALARTDRAGRIGGWVLDGASAAICGLGIFWFVTRTFGA